MLIDMDASRIVIRCWGIPETTICWCRNSSAPEDYTWKDSKASRSTPHDPNRRRIAQWRLSTVRHPTRNETAEGHRTHLWRPLSRLVTRPTHPLRPTPRDAVAVPHRTYPLPPLDPQPPCPARVPSLSLLLPPPCVLAHPLEHPPAGHRRHMLVKQSMCTIRLCLHIVTLRGTLLCMEHC